VFRLTDDTQTIEFEKLRQEHYKVNNKNVDSIILEITEQSRIDTDQKYQGICGQLDSLSPEFYIERDGSTIDTSGFSLDRATRDFDPIMQTWNFRVTLMKWTT
jgi:hypothetical protein